MKLKMTRFRVYNYRNIYDSDWIPVDKVTAFVGCNESGKSALLKALHKFNPAVEEPYDNQRELPRDCWEENYRNNESKSVCKVEFELTDKFRAELQKRLGVEEAPKIVILTRCYDGSLECECNFPDDAVNPRELHTALDNLAQGTQRIKGEGDTAQELRTNLATWANERKKDLSDIPDLIDLRGDRGIGLLEKVRGEVDSYNCTESADLVKAFQDIVDDLLSRARAEPLSKQLDKEIENELPVFIYFDSYELLDSKVDLRTFVQELDEPRVRMIKAMFTHIGIKPEEIYELGHEDATDDTIKEGQRNKDSRNSYLNSVSNRISQEFSKWYGQRKHKIKYQADGSYFRIWVSDELCPDINIELESRSRGFQWFFSFYTIFSAEADNGHKNAILLLDEPGLHLHPTAQQELLSFFEKLAEKNLIIYTTHSPYLIDVKKIHRVRTVTTDKSGQSCVSIDDWEKVGKDIFPIQAAVGHTIVEELLHRKKNLLVEGRTDDLYLNFFSKHCKKAGRQGLPEDIYITECDGASKISFYTNIFLNHGVRPIVLLDSDKEGKKRQESLTSKLYTKHKDAVLMIGEVLGQDRCEIEDIIGEEEILPALNNIVGVEISLSQDDRGKKSLVERIEKAAACSNTQLPKGWKSEIAQRIVDKWSETDNIPKDVLGRAEGLFKEITNRFNKIDQITVAIPEQDTYSQTTDAEPLNS